MKLLRNLFKVTIIFTILSLLIYILVSPVLAAIEGENTHLFISIPLLIIFLAVIKTYDIEKLLKL